MIENLVKITEKLISKGFSNLSKPQVKDISELIIALFYNKTLKLEVQESNFGKKLSFYKKNYY